MRTSIISAISIVVSISAFFSPSVQADLIPPGNKSVTHKLVFQDSPLLESHRLIAMPTRGFGGHEEIQAGRPFYFSSKYQTRIYAVPKDYRPPSKRASGEPLPFPTGEIPIASTTYVPLLSPVASLLSTVRLVDVDETTINIELVGHEEFDDLGNPVSLGSVLIPLSVISMCGLVGCIAIWRRTKSNVLPEEA